MGITRWQPLYRKCFFVTESIMPTFPRLFCCYDIYLQAAQKKQSTIAELIRRLKCASRHVCFVSPWWAITSDTVSRWIKYVMFWVCLILIITFVLFWCPLFVFHVICLLVMCNVLSCKLTSYVEHFQTCMYWKNQFIVNCWRTVLSWFVYSLNLIQKGWSWRERQRQ